MLQITTITAYVFSLISFAMFVYWFLFEKPKFQSTSQPAQTLGEALPHGAIADMAQLIESLAKLTDSFSKGGRGMALLVSSIFFLLIAAVGSGLDSVAKAIAT